MTDIAVDKQISDEHVDEIVAPELEEEIQASLEPDAVHPPTDQRPHPLQPGGVRFEQIYAKGKQAEREVQALKERLAATDAKLELLLSGKAQPGTSNDEPEYSWDQLETFISQGRITRADAQAHREQVIERRIAKKAEDAAIQRTQTASRQETLATHIGAYVKAVPAILQEDSADRQRLDEEFDWLASVQGIDSTKMNDTDRKALQLTALRNVYGPVDSVGKREASVKTELPRGLPGGIAPASNKNKDQALLDGLSKEQKVHYKKMMDTGRYPGGWKEVVEELKFDPKNRAKK